MKQISFLKELGYGGTSKAEFGGRSTHGKRKTSRPLDSKKPVHLILKSSKAHGRYSLSATRNWSYIYKLIYTKADKFHIRIAGFSNVGNHLHVHLRFSYRRDFQKFLKSITALIARHVTGARRGKRFGKFWDFLAYTKVVKSWAHQKWLKTYLTANNIEASHGPYWREKYLQKSKQSMILQN